MSVLPGYDDWLDNHGNPGLPDEGYDTSGEDDDQEAMLTGERDQHVIDLYVQQKMSIREVAAAEGSSRERIWRILTNAGVIRHRGEVRSGPPPNPDAVSRRQAITYRPDPKTLEWLREYAAENEWSLNEVIDACVAYYRTAPGER